MTGSAIWHGRHASAKNRCKKYRNARGLQDSSTTLERLEYLRERVEFYGRCTKAELVRFCNQRQLPATGIKAALIKRLEQADENPTFHQFLDLAPELRRNIYEMHYYASKPNSQPARIFWGYASQLKPKNHIYPAGTAWDTKTHPLILPLPTQVCAEMRQEYTEIHYRACQLVIEINFCRDDPVFRLSKSTEDVLNAISSDFFGCIRHILIVGPALGDARNGKSAWEVDLRKDGARVKMVETPWDYLPQAKALKKTTEGEIVEGLGGLVREVRTRDHERKLLKKDVAKILDVFWELLETSK